MAACAMPRFAPTRMGGRVGVCGFFFADFLCLSRAQFAFREFFFGVFAFALFGFFFVAFFPFCEFFDGSG